ncbi:NADPH-dependent aldehyde reductase Ahr [Legionella quinlivanii]|uniref:NADPH-dependent aldehyde reductase Ahr n=1 Tax=Legionella quinlivanii TaxID=45073 RepID=UPI002244D335|nr:NAD(P)-dependent alcohol dehydrogenase [Legionella quinlivanii]MCW8451904.1 NAD(P)-dependent alcohol dehydrogenase [Legionella quinlivanii]
MTKVHAYATSEKSSQLSPFEYDLGEIGADQVDIKVESCGICHSDLAMIDNEWGFSNYPIVPGHEVIGMVKAVGEHVKNLKIGQRVGLGWFSGSCMHCHRCLSGNHNLCGTAEQTIIGRHGGFADTVRCNSEWAIALPDTIDAKNAGPLFCGGITVFNPIVQFEVSPTHRVGVIGIGGLGHLALQFLNKWGCEVTAFSSSPGKEAEAREMGAHHVVNSKDPKAIEALAGQLDFIMNTTNANLDWSAYINALAPHGRFHTVGVTSAPIPAQSMQLIMAQRSISGSPLGSPATIEDMLQFCARHNIMPMTEHFAMKDVNKALDHLRSGKARYRIVLDN